MLCVDIRVIQKVGCQEVGSECSAIDRLRFLPVSLLLLSVSIHSINQDSLESTETAAVGISSSMARLLLPRFNSPPGAYSYLSRKLDDNTTPNSDLAKAQPIVGAQVSPLPRQQMPLSKLRFQVSLIRHQCAFLETATLVTCLEYLVLAGDLLGS